MDFLTFTCITEWLGSALKGQRLRAVDRVRPSLYALTFRRHTLLIGARPPSGSAVLALLDGRPPFRLPPDGMTSALRSRLRGRVLTGARRHPAERIWWLLFTDTGLCFSVERGRARLALAEEDLQDAGVPHDPLDPEELERRVPRRKRARVDLEAIAACLRAPLERGRLYRAGDGALSAWPEGNESVGLSDDPRVEALLIEAGREAIERLDLEYFGRMRREREKRVRRSLEAAKRDIEKCSGWEEYRRNGELLAAAFGRIERGRRRVTVQDWYEGGERTIDLDPALGPRENVDRWFRRARKGRQGIAHAQRRRSELEAELSRLSAEETAGLPEESERISRYAGREKAAKERRAPGEPVRTLSASDGHRILCGKGDRGNAYLLRRYARGRDLWLHARDVAGAHVLVPLERGEPVPGIALREAAAVAAYYSKARQAGEVTVIHTLAKYVRPIKGAAPGLVTVSQEKTLVVSPGLPLVAK